MGYWGKEQNEKRENSNATVLKSESIEFLNNTLVRRKENFQVDSGLVQ